MGQGADQESAKPDLPPEMLQQEELNASIASFREKYNSAKIDFCKEVLAATEFTSTASGGAAVQIIL